METNVYFDLPRPVPDKTLRDTVEAIGGWPPELTNYFVQAGVGYNDVLRILLQAMRIQ